MVDIITLVDVLGALGWAVGLGGGIWLAVEHGVPWQQWIKPIILGTAAALFASPLILVDPTQIVSLRAVAYVSLIVLEVAELWTSARRDHD